VRIIVVDDHPIVRNGIEQALNEEPDLQVVAMAGDCLEGVKILSTSNPDLAIVDLRMPGGGINFIRQAKKIAPQCRFIILTSFASQTEVAQALEENVDAYLLKAALPEELINVIRLVAQGRRYYDPEIIDMLMIRNHYDPLSELTVREKEILQELAAGLSNKAFAQKLYISENTVKKHICNILEKLQLQDRTQAALFAVQHGFGQDFSEVNI